MTGQPDETRSEALSADDSYVLGLLADRDRLQQENERLRADRQAAIRESTRAADIADKANDVARAARAEVTRLREAVEAVETLCEEVEGMAGKPVGSDPATGGVWSDMIAISRVRTALGGA